MRAQHLALGIGLSASLVAQESEWQQWSPANRPSARERAAMAFDAQRGTVLMVGGITSSGSLVGETWEWDGETWTQLQVPSGSNPPNHYGAAIAEYPTRNSIVLFIGRGIAGSLRSRTHAWDGQGWALQAPSSAPSPRWMARMAHDPVSDRVILFGGLGSTSSPNPTFGDTWAWDGTDWTQLTPISSPPARFAHSMCLDPTTGQILLFGGQSSTGFFNDTWTWTGSTWQQLSPLSTSPSIRDGASMVADTTQNRVLLFGGGMGSLQYDDTWAWDGQDWTLLTPSAKPPERVSAMMSWDALRREAVLFGGYIGLGAVKSYLGDTWSLLRKPAAASSSLGAGCPGSVTGVPQLLTRGRPALGQSFAIDLAGAPPAALAALLISTTPANLDLATFGAPGCVAYANPHVTIPVLADFNGAWAWPGSGFPIPNLRQFVGGMFWSQFLVADLQANPLGIITTAGGRADIGY